MNDKPPEAVKLPRRFRLYRPFGAVVLWLEGLVLIGAGTTIYLALAYALGLGRLPGVNCIAGIGAGLACGLLIAIEEKWRLRRWLEVEARALASGHTPWGIRLLRALLFTPIFVSGLGLVYIVLRPAGGPIALAAIGSLFLPSIFLYHAYTRVYDRARQLLAESAERAAASPPAPSRPSRLARWINPLGVISIMGVLVLGAWLQWRAPILGESEPKTYEKREEVDRTVTRLTYGGDAADPALSRDGRFVAYRKAVGLGNARLEIMRTDGSRKRFVTGETGPSPDFCHPLTWSSDGKRILLIGDKPRRPAKTWLETPDEYEPSSLDLWTVDVASGAARRLTDDDGYVAGIWLPAVRKIAAIRSTRRKWARLWLMDERGGNRLKVANLKLRRHSLAAQPWHDGHEVVAVGTAECAGIWSVDAITGKATRISDMKVRWALPLAIDWLVLAVDGRAYPPFHQATSIAILDVPSGEVHWALRDMQGVVSHPCLVQQPPTLIFSLWLERNEDLWALRLRDGKLRRLTWGGSVSNTAVGPTGTAVFYQARNEERERFRWFNIGYSIWRLTPGRPVGSW